jgi:hypothetical protein
MNARSRLEVSVYCTGKDPLTAELARKIAKRSRHGKASAYRCDNCGHWHVGTRLVRTENIGKRG